MNQRECRNGENALDDSLALRGAEGISYSPTGGLPATSYASTTPSLATSSKGAECRCPPSSRFCST
jgi:hypothetical protein